MSGWDVPQQSTYPSRSLSRIRGEEDEDSKSGSNWVVNSIVAFFITALFEWLWPDVIPFSFFEFWTLKGSLWDAIFVSWPLLVWAVAINVVIAVLSRNPEKIKP